MRLFISHEGHVPYIYIFDVRVTYERNNRGEEKMALAAARRANVSFPCSGCCLIYQVYLLDGGVLIDVVNYFIGAT